MRNRKEPGSLPFWLTVILLVLVIVPYPFMGATEPRLWNVPVWFYVSLGASVAIAALSAWRIWTAWGDDRDE